MSVFQSSLQETNPSPRSSENQDSRLVPVEDSEDMIVL